MKNNFGILIVGIERRHNEQ